MILIGGEGSSGNVLYDGVVGKANFGQSEESENLEEIIINFIHLYTCKYVSSTEKSQQRTIEHGKISKYLLNYILNLCCMSRNTSEGILESALM